MTGAPASRPKLEAVAWAIGLARLEEPRPPDTLDWERVRRIAVRERLAMLCWLRSGEVIRRHAAADVVAAWRRHALAADARHERQLAQLRDVLATFRARDIDAIVLKGAALAVRAYGTPRARVSTDIDLLVEPRDRARARATLAALGWRHRSGAPPLDETLELEDGRRFFLELHSGLLHDTLRHHELRPSTVDEVDVGGMFVRTLGGPELPVYLAAHAATHESPALLWLADLDAVWHSMAAPARDTAREVARRAGLHGHLAWALDQSAALAAASEGSRDAILGLGFDDDGERRDEPLRRALRLAPSGLAAVRVAGAWIWPRHVRDSASATLALAGARLARLIAPAPVVATQARAELTVAPPGQPRRARTLELGRDDLLSLVADVVQASSQVWVKVRGASMAPAIPVGADVRLGPVRERSLRKGDVVLARLPSGLPVLHRVKAVRAHEVVLQGDALPNADAPVEYSAIVARADAVRVDAVELPVPTRGPRPWRRIGAAWMRRLAPSRAGDSHTRG